MQIKATVELWQKGTWYIARIPELDFIAQGRSADEAKANLREVIRIQIQEMSALGTLDDYLSECGFETKGDVVESIHEMLGFEKQTVQVP